MVLGHIAQDPRKRTHFDGPVFRDGHVVGALQRGGHSDVAAALPCDLIAELAKSRDECLAVDIAGNLCGEDDLLHHVQADHLRHVRCLEVTTDRILHVRLQLLQIIAIREDGMIQGPGLEAALRRLLHNEDDLLWTVNLVE